MLLMDEYVSFRSDQGGLPGLYVVRRHHPLPKSLTEKERPSHFDNDRLILYHNSKPGLFYLFKTSLISLSPLPLCVAAECVSVRVDGWQGWVCSPLGSQQPGAGNGFLSSGLPSSESEKFFCLGFVFVFWGFFVVVFCCFLHIAKDQISCIVLDTEYKNYSSCPST